MNITGNTPTLLSLRWSAGGGVALPILAYAIVGDAQPPVMLISLALVHLDGMVPEASFNGLPVQIETAYPLGGHTHMLVTLPAETAAVLVKKAEVTKAE